MKYTVTYVSSDVLYLACTSIFLQAFPFSTIERIVIFFVKLVVLIYSLYAT